MTTPRRTVGFNFLEEPELPGPQVTEAQAEHIVAQHYGITARAQLLGSNQDCNFVIYDANDDIVGVLKIANPAFNATELEAQDAAADLIAEAEPSLRIAVPLPNVAGDEYTAITGLLDKTAYVRLLRYLPGGTLLESGYLAPAAVAGLGEVAAGSVARWPGSPIPGSTARCSGTCGTAPTLWRNYFPTSPTRRNGRRSRKPAASAWSRISPARRASAPAGDASRSDRRQRRRDARRGRSRAP